MLRDLRHAVRVLLQAKGWTAVVLLSLALGIGANTAAFSAINGLLLSKLPVETPDTLVRLRWYGRNDTTTSSLDYGATRAMPSGERVRTTFSYRMFQEFRAANRTMTDLFACAPAGRGNVVADGRAETASLFLATGNYHGMLGIRARMGRLLTVDDDRLPAPPVAVISERYWRSRFAGNPGVIGKEIRINDVPVTIVGVTPTEFTGVQRVGEGPHDIALPLALDSRINTTDTDRLREPGYWWLQVMGRLKPGVTPDQVRGNLAGVFQHQSRAGLDAYLTSLTGDALQTEQMNRRGRSVPMLLAEAGNRGVYDANANEVAAAATLVIVVALVLLIVCANVANLLLSRAATRQNELSVRLSMGATRARVVRQLLTESLLLAAIGGVLGIFVAYWSKYLLEPVERYATGLDWRVLTFTIGVTAVTGVIFGIVPALRATGGGAGAALRENSRSVAGANSLLSRGLLVAQISISLVLLIGAGLLLRTVDNLRRVDVGFNPRNLLLVEVDTDLARYEDDAAFRYFHASVDRLRTVPGIQAVTLSDPALLTGGASGTSFFVHGRAHSPGDLNDIHRVVVSPNFFGMMEIPMVAGRAFTMRDDKGAPRVAIINEAAARRHFPNENPVGRRIGTSPAASGDIEIVGVVGDARYEDLRGSVPPTLYIPHLQRGPSGLWLLARTTTDPGSAIGAVREALRQTDPNVPVLSVRTQATEIENRFQQEKLLAEVYTLFGGLAVVVAAIGLFGLMSYNVARRTREIGIRMAMGAQREQVLHLVLRESMLLVTAGIAIGIAGAIGTGRLVASQLFGVETTDPATLVAAVALMIGVSAAAGYLPARRATRIDPMVALRYE